MNFKEVIYSNYSKNHTTPLYGAASLDIIRKASPTWNYYFNSLLPAEKSASILDIGCGNGSFVYFLQKKGYLQAEGIDISAQLIEEGAHLGITGIQCADLRGFLSDKSRSYDCIIARDVMEHFSKNEIFDILTTVKSVLKSGGAFIMQSPNGEGIFYSSIFYSDFTHEIAFTESSLRQIFLNTGFNEVHCYQTGPVPHGLLSTLRWLIWQLMVLKIRFYKMVETGDYHGIFTQNLIAKAVIGA